MVCLLPETTWERPEWFSKRDPERDYDVSVSQVKAGTTSFSDWFLLGRKLPELERIQVIQKTSSLDPALFIGKASAPVLFQFARRDPHVPVEKAEEFFKAAKEPKKILWYDAGHGLNELASRDRQQWLREKLGLR